MGKALEVLNGFSTAPSTTFTALTMASGTSSTVRNARPDSRIRLLQCWADNQGAGALRIRSPQMHDNVQGIRLNVVASEVQPLLPDNLIQPLQPQDQLTLENTGSATAGDIESAGFLLWYEDLVGVAGRFATADEVRKRGINLLTVENTITTGTAGNFSGEEAINAEFDLLRANTDYAIAGYLVSAECCSVRWRGVDFGNLGVGGPGFDTGRFVTRGWFMDLSDYFGIECVPVFNSANKAGTLVDAAQDENGTDVTVTTILIELAD